MAGKDPLRRIEAIRQLLGMFRFERGVYLCVTVVAVVILIGCAAKLLFSDNTDWVLLLGLFGPAGAMTYTTGRLLKMWNDALGVLFPISQGTDDGEGGGS